MSKKTYSKKQIEDFLDQLNQKYSRLHTSYENLFWRVYMGEQELRDKMIAAREKRDNFQSDEKLLAKINDHADFAIGKNKDRLLGWANFLSLHQVPDSVKQLRNEIATVEASISEHRATRKEGYIDPKTKKFVKASKGKLYLLMRSHEDEKVRKAAFVAVEKLNRDNVDDYVKLVNLRNQYAKALGYEDFYEYKAQLNEGMSKSEIFAIFDKIYNETKTGYFKEFAKRAKKNKKLLQVWNRSYLLSGDYQKLDDPYFQFSDSVERWGRSFAAMGVKFRDSKIVLDLVEREGKHNNGFCHWPELVRYDGKKRVAGTSNFTANVVLGQVGAGKRSMITLFHEGGHAAHLLNSDQKDVFYNHEYPPASTAWDETQSMFMDTAMTSIEWTMRYAKDGDSSYPFELFEKKVKELSWLNAGSVYGIYMIMSFERMVYEEPKLTSAKVIRFAKEAFAKINPEGSTAAITPLTAMHIYDWEASCAYHGYGLADIAVAQWRDYFYKKYGYIVDNKNIYKEMVQVWKLGASKTFPELVKLATGKKLSSASYIKKLNMGPDQIIKTAKKRLKKMESVPQYRGKVNLGAEIKLVHGKKTVATNKKSFADMAQKYKDWIIKETEA